MLIFDKLMLFVTKKNLSLSIYFVYAMFRNYRSLIQKKLSVSLDYDLHKFFIFIVICDMSPSSEIKVKSIDTCKSYLRGTLNIVQLLTLLLR